VSVNDNGAANLIVFQHASVETLLVVAGAKTLLLSVVFREFCELTMGSASKEAT
jgi:hypothetical protein